MWQEIIKSEKIVKNTQLGENDCQYSKKYTLLFYYF